MRLSTLPLVLVLGYYCLLIAGCPDKRETPAAPPAAVTPPESLLGLPPPKADKNGKVDDLDQAKYEARKYAELAAQANARYQVLSEQRYEDSLRSQVMWITGICLLIAAIAGVAAFLVPIGKKACVSVAIGCTVVATCAQAFREAVPYLPWIGGAVVVGGAIWVAINWRKLGQSVQVAADHGDRLEDWLLSDVLPHVDASARDLINKTIADVKETTQQQAQRMGVYDPLQYLRGKTQTLWQRLFS